MASIERKVDKVDVALCTAALLAVFSFLVWTNVPVLRCGVCSADDAYTANAAKNVARGRGYGYPQSPQTFVWFDPILSIGPSLILPVAFLVWLFGPVDQLPGIATFVIFLGQMIGTVIVLSRRFGWAPASGFLSATIWLVMMASLKNWYFGALLGEPVTFGFILLGIACLVVAGRDRAIAAAGLCLSLALMTKQIALFPVAGIVGAWLITRIYDRIGRAVFFRRAAILLFTTASLPLTFEATKLITLGFKGYQDLARRTVDVVGHMGVVSVDLSVRWDTFKAIFLQSYVSTPLFAALVVGSVLLLVLSRRNRDEERINAWRFAIFAWSGAAVHLAYVLFLSILWQRYFWIGIAILMTALCVPLLSAGSKLRVAAMLALMVGALGFGLHRRFLSIHEYASTLPMPIERAAVVKVLDEHPDLPWLAQDWSNIFDILYLRDKEGAWHYEANLAALRDKDFIVLVNHNFTNARSGFFESVIDTCEPITPGAKVILLYRCGERFWSAHSYDRQQPTTDIPIPYPGVVDKGDCDSVEGWVFNPYQLTNTIVELHIDEKLVETMPARNPRPDLTSWGTGRHGFSFKIPSTYKDERPHLVTVKVAGSKYVVPVYQQGLYLNLECRP